MKWYITLSLIVVSLTVQSQVYCTYSGGQCTRGLANPSPYAQGVVANICNVLGIRYIATFQGLVGNACASNYNGMPIITYNSQFMNNLYSHNSWAPISVMAHEVGHHLNLDATMLGAFKHPWTKELQADFISGYVLFKLGASLSDGQSAFRIMFSYIGSQSHPDSPKRMAAMAQGYYQASQGF